MVSKIKLVVFNLVLLCILTMSGCSDSENLFSYSHDNSEIADITSVTGESYLYEAPPYFRNVCVIPKEAVGVDKKDVFTAKGLLLVDVDDNSMLYAEGIYDKLYPASLTKLATALVCFKYGNMEDDVKISYNASHISEPHAKTCFLQEGDVINFETLLTSFLVYSGNDAGIALAEHISGSEKEFMKLVNKELAEIGAVDTHFVNSHGLHDDNHYTTVYDIYLMLNELSKYDKFLEIASKDTYIADFKDADGNNVRKVYDSTIQYITGDQKLPKGFKVLAGKTGTTTAAGNCLALLVSGKDGHKYIAIVMKAYSYGSLYSQINELLKLTK